MRIDVSLPDRVPDFRLSPAEFAAADRQAVSGTLSRGRQIAIAEYKRQAPELLDRAVRRRVTAYRRKLWIGLEPVNITRLRTTETIPPPEPGPGGFGVAGQREVFLLPRRADGAAFRRYIPYRRGVGRTGASIVPVVSDVPPHAGRRAADVAYRFMIEYYEQELGRQVDRRLAGGVGAGNR